MAISINITVPTDAPGLRAAAAAIGIRPAIKAARVAMPYPDVKAAPLRRLVSIACTAEVAHADADFWRLAFALGVSRCFDERDEPNASAAFRLPHEARAGAALTLLTHLQTMDSDRRGPWARWERWTRADKAAWLGQRRGLLHRFIKAANAYRAARAALA